AGTYSIFRTTNDPSAACCTWVLEGGNNTLPQGLTFGSGLVGAAQATCPSGAGATGITAGTDGCIIFNSRGLPLDAAFTQSTALRSLYITDGLQVYKVEVNSMGNIRSYITSVGGTTFTRL